jgi:hypothetical protein
VPGSRRSIIRFVLVSGLGLSLALIGASAASARKSWSGNVVITDAATPVALNTDGVPFAGAFDTLSGTYRLQADFDVRQEDAFKDPSGTEFELTGGGKTNLTYALSLNFCESVVNPDSGSCAGVGSDPQAKSFSVTAGASAAGRLGFRLHPKTAAQTDALTLFLPRDDRPFANGPKPPGHQAAPFPFVIDLSALLGNSRGGLPLSDVQWERLASGAGCPDQTQQVLEDQAYKNGRLTDTRAGDYNDDRTGCAPPTQEPRGYVQKLALWPAATWFDEVITAPSEEFHGLSGKDGCTYKSTNHVLFQDYSMCGFYDYLKPVDVIKGTQYVAYDVRTPFKPYYTAGSNQQVPDDLWVDSPAYAPYNGYGYTIWHRTLSVRYHLKRD